MNVIPFPTVRRIRFIRTTAAAMARSTPCGAEKLLTAALSRQWDALVKKGISAEIATNDLDVAERAIRSRQYLMERQSGDAA